MPTDAIRTTPIERCYLCSSEGTPRYENVIDDVYGVPGHWTFLECENKACQLFWITPRALEQDIPKLYNRYYTHVSEASDTQQDSGTAAPKQGPMHIIRKIWQLLPIAKARRSAYLCDLPPGRVLDIGCGNGVLGRQLMELNWDVYGQEVDTRAAAEARRQGLKIFECSIDDLIHQGLSFDAIVLSHVIEHVSDPKAFARQCLKLLKSGGRMTILTPNIWSTSHRLYRKFWPGLETPRHFFIFNPKTLAAALSGLEVERIKVFTPITNLRFMYATGLQRVVEHSPWLKCIPRKVLIPAMLGFSVLVKILLPKSGEECAAILYK